MLSLTLFTAAFAGLFLSKRILGDYFTPPAIYHFFWSFALGGLYLDWVSYEPVRQAGWSVMILGYLGFMGACFMVGTYAAFRPGWLHAKPRLNHLNRRRFEHALLFLFLLGIFGFLMQLVHLQLQFGLGTFLTDPIAAREEHTNVKYLGFFNLLNVANFVLALAYLVLYRKPRKWVILIMLWALATTFVTTDRTRFFYMIIWAFYIGVYLYRRVSLSPKFLAAAAVTMLALLSFFVLISKLYKKEAFEDNMEYVNLSSDYAMLVDPYIYLTGSFPVLQAFLDDKPERTYGKATFEPLVKVLELVFPDLERAEIVGKFYRVPIELNACTYLEPFYKDFGYLGVVLGPFGLGLLAMLAYVAMRQRKTLFSVYFAALFSFCATISIFVNHFTQTATWFFVIIGYVVYRYCHSSVAQPTTPFRKNIFGADAAAE